MSHSLTPVPPSTGIPTSFAGTNFRSRLEARWAAFFSIVGWDWVYEPVDGAGYVPDFLIKGDSPLFVEVKPATSETEYRQPVQKIVDGIGPHWNRDVLIVGADAVMRGDVAGILVDFLHGPNDWNTSPAEWVYCPTCVSLGIATSSTSGHMRPCGHAAPKGGDPANQHPRNLWALAGNAVQWRPAA